MPDVKQYKIKANHSISRPTHILYIDTETKHVDKDTTQYHRMDYAWTCYQHVRNDREQQSEDWRFWNKTKELCKYIDSKVFDKTTLYIFGHNVFFDLQVSDFFYYFTRWGWRLEFLYDKALTYILVIKDKTRTIKCISTTNYFPHTLEKLGKMLNLPKFDVDFDKSTRKELIDYCYRDVEICKAAIEHYIKFIDTHDLGAFRMTRSSQAFGAYRHRFMSKSICVHRDEELDNFERLSYFGGRTECFRIGEIRHGPFVSFDINSMYPFVMKTYRYPVRYLTTVKNIDEDHLKYIMNKYCVLGEIAVDTDEPVYAYRRDNKVIFPIGTFRANVCSEGLRYAYNNKHLVEIKKLLVYEKDWIFQEYVDYFYPIKQQYKQDDNKIMERISKDFLNSLYGKFGQKRDLVESVESIDYDGYNREEIYDLVTGKTETITQLFNTQTITYGSESTKNSMVAIAAHVTEYARFLLWKMIKTVGTDNMLYCDTDSLKIRRRHAHLLNQYLDESKLGMLKNEGEFNKFVIYGAKYYETEDYTKIKGVPKHAEKVGPYTYRYNQFMGQSSHLRLSINRWFKVTEVIKKAQPQYNKGRVLKGGKVRPFKISEF